MGHHHVTETVRGHVVALPVEASPPPFTLVQTTVDEQAAGPVLDEEHAAGDRTCRAKKREGRGHVLLRGERWVRAMRVGVRCAARRRVVRSTVRDSARDS